jgi:hypothetical protein
MKIEIQKGDKVKFVEKNKRSETVYEGVYSGELYKNKIQRYTQYKVFLKKRTLEYVDDKGILKTKMNIWEDDSMEALYLSEEFYKGII